MTLLNVLRLSFIFTPLAFIEVHAARFETKGVGEIKSKGVFSISTEEKDIPIPTFIDTEDPNWDEVIPNRDIRSTGHFAAVQVWAKES